MAEFAQYYVDFLKKFFDNFIKFFSTILSTITDIFTKDIPNYIDSLTLAAKTFDLFGWVLFILSFIASFIFVFFLTFRIVMFIRRFIIFRAKEIDKDQLIEELAKEKEKNVKLTIEKNQLYALKVNSMYSSPFKLEEPTSVEQVSEVVEPVLVNRFSRLSALDKMYSTKINFISNAENDKMRLNEMIDMFVNYAASQHNLYYEKSTIRKFIAGMGTSKFLILEGISGTGKTSLPYAMSKFLGNDASIISVQPSWRDKTDIMGYLNEFTKTYNETTFLTSIYEAIYRPDPSLVILDEMNLARIEYYFAELLSVMEMPNKSEWKIEVVANEHENDPKNINDGKVLIPQNIWFIGTANQDDSTFTITDKVYDRAITLDLNTKADYFDAPITNSISLSNFYFEILFENACKNNPVSESTKNMLSKLDEFIKSKFKITFGNRILRQILKFVPIYIECGGTELEAIDFLLQSKILRKFNGLNLVFLRKELKELITLLEKIGGKNEFKLSIDYINALIERA